MVKSYSGLSVLTVRQGSLWRGVLDHGPYQAYCSRRAPEQPQEYQPGNPQEFANRNYRTVRFRQVVVGLRHHLRRGSAPLRGVAFGIRTPIAGPDGASGRGRDRRAFAFDCHRAKDDDSFATINGGYDYRDLRLFTL